MTVIYHLSEVLRETEGKDLQIQYNRYLVMLTLPVNAFIFNGGKGLFSQLIEAIYSFI